MPLKRLVLDDFRNLQRVEFRPAARLNFIQGINGSGKTSLLEAISTLAMGRSFRTRKYRNIIRSDQDQFSLFAELVQLGEPERIGVARRRTGKSQFKLSDRPAVSAAQLAEVLPFQVINSQSFLLLEGGPTERRRFLDWMVFHVKQSYRRLWADYARCLKQRNSMLRSGNIRVIDIKVWDDTLSILAEEIDAMRAEVVELYLPELDRYLSQCGFSKSGLLSLEYERGWGVGKPLVDELLGAREREARLGYTTVGPHKADIRIRIDRKDVSELFSRGQQKSLIAAMYMAQLDVFKSRNRRDCILLIDDLPAELDRGNQQMLCRWVAHLDRVQTFITGIDLSPIIETWPAPLSDSECKMFHVKHGQVTEQPLSGATHDR